MAICGTAAACKQRSAGGVSSWPLAAPAARPRNRRPGSLRHHLCFREENLSGALMEVILVDFQVSESPVDQGTLCTAGACHAAATDSSSFATFGLAARARPVDIAIEPGPHNSRCIWAGVDVAAPQQAVWEALTSYEQLGTFIPGVAVAEAGSCGCASTCSQQRHRSCSFYTDQPVARP